MSRRMQASIASCFRCSHDCGSVHPNDADDSQVVNLKLRSKRLRKSQKSQALASRQLITARSEQQRTTAVPAPCRTLQPCRILLLVFKVESPDRMQGLRGVGGMTIRRKRVHCGSRRSQLERTAVRDRAPRSYFDRLISRLGRDNWPWYFCARSSNSQN